MRLTTAGRSRWGSTARASLLSVAAGVVVLGMLVAGVQVGVLGPVVSLMLPGLLAAFFGFEVLAASLYAASRNLLAIALCGTATAASFRPLPLAAGPFAGDGGTGV